MYIGKIAVIRGWKGHDYFLDAAQEVLKKMTLEERLELPALERGREDLIVSGTEIVIQVMEVFKIESLAFGLF